MRARGLMLLALQFIFLSNIIAQKSTGNSLLWRISGKGLTRPSYVFGTFHSQDKRLFNFGDSVYAAIEKVEGLALEVDFEQLVDSMMAMAIQQKEKAASQINPKGDDDVVPPMDMKVEKVSKGTRGTWTNSGKMETIVDAYLYGIAQRSSKWLGGIEDPQDQIMVINELGCYVPSNPKEKQAAEKQMEQIKLLYINEDLGGMEKIMLGQGNDRFVDIALNKRNQKMSRRIDSLMAIRSMFFAVGAAHLPGEAGLIKLLSDQGYTVTPVNSSKRIPAKSYMADAEKRAWPSVHSEIAQASFAAPIALRPYNMYRGLVNIEAGFDLASFTMFMIMKVDGTAGDDQEMIERMLKAMNASLEGQAEKISTPLKAVQQRFLFGGQGGMIRVARTGNRRFVMFTFSSEISASLESNSLKFFNSLKPDAGGMSGTYQFTSIERGITADLYARTTPMETILEDGSKKIDYVINNGTGGAQVFSFRDMPNSVLDDSVELMYQGKGMLDQLKEPVVELIRATEDYTRLRMSGENTKGAYIDLNLILRGQQFVMIGTVTEKPGEAEDQMKKLTLKAMQIPPMREYHSNNIHYVSFAPLKVDTAVAAEDVLVARDSFTGTRVSYLAAPYYSHTWTDSSSSSFLRDIAERYEDGDSILSEGPVTNGSLRGWQRITTTAGSTSACITRLIPHSDTVVVLRAWVYLPDANNPEIQKFFTTFRIDDPKEPIFYESHLQEVLQDMTGTDTALVSLAADELESHSYSAKELQLIHKALLFNYSLQSSEADPYFSLANVLVDMQDPSTEAEVVKAYAKLSPAMSSHKYELLRILASMETKSSRENFMRLLEKGLPDGGYPYQIQQALSDSLELTAPYFPRMLAVKGSSEYRGAMMRVGTDLLSESMIDTALFTPYRTQYIHDVAIGIDSVSKGLTSYSSYSNQINWLLHMHYPETEAMISELQKVQNHDDLYEVFLALAENEYDLPRAMVDTLASDIVYRAGVWASLEAVDKTSLMPARFMNTSAMGEAMLYNQAADEVESPTVTFIKEAKDPDGKLYRLYSLTSEEDGAGYLGIVGPVVSATDIAGLQDRTFIYWMEEADAKEPAALFAKALEAWKEELKEDSE